MLELLYCCQCWQQARTQVLGQLRASDFVRARGTDIRDINTKTATTGAWSRRACWQVGIRVFGVGRLIYQWPCALCRDVPQPGKIRQRGGTTKDAEGEQGICIVGVTLIKLLNCKSLPRFVSTPAVSWWSPRTSCPTSPPTGWSTTR